MNVLIYDFLCENVWSLETKDSFEHYELEWKQGNHCFEHYEMKSKQGQNIMGSIKGMKTGRTQEWKCGSVSMILHFKTNQNYNITKKVRFWEQFSSYLRNSISNPAQFWWKWAGLAGLVSRCCLCYVTRTTDTQWRHKSK